MKRNNRTLRSCLFVSLLTFCVATSFASDAPRDPRGTEIGQSLVKWEWDRVSGAQGYEVTVDGSYIGITEDNHYYSFNLWAGSHSLTVRAKFSNGDLSDRTPTVKIKVSDWFSANNYNRSYLVGQESPAATSSSAPAPLNQSDGFGAPANARGSVVDSRTVKWEWSGVSDAASYEVTVDGINVGSTSDTNYTSYDMWEGDHSLTIRARNGNGEFSEPTDTVKIEVTANSSSSSYSVAQENQPPPPNDSDPVAQIEAVTTPENTRGSVIDTGTVKWKWSSVSGASSYDVTVDGAFAGSTGDTDFTSYDLWEGNHSMTVIAVGSNGDRSEQSDTVKLAVGGSTVVNEPVVRNDDPDPVVGGNPDAANEKSMIDSASYGYNEIYRHSGYDLVFSDEFDGTALNPYRWNTGLRWDGEYNGERFEYRVVNGENQFYVNIFSEDEEHIKEITPTYNPFKFNGSRLAIQAVKNPLKTNNDDRSYGSLQQMSSQQEFLSGVIASHNKFSQKYGYFEARIKIPGHVGAFPAFWLFHEKRSWEGTQRTEIDIMENLGHAPWYIYNSFHYFKNVTTSYSGDANFVKPYPNGQIYTGTDYSLDYHVYAVEWEPNKITWFIDGDKVSELEHEEVNFEELYVKLNLAVGGNWTNFPENAGGLGRSSGQHFPTGDDLNNFNNPSLEIDYVRVYKKK